MDLGYGGKSIVDGPWSMAKKYNRIRFGDETFATDHALMQLLLTIAYSPCKKSMAGIISVDETFATDHALLTKCSYYGLWTMVYGLTHYSPLDL